MEVNVWSTLLPWYKINKKQILNCAENKWSDSRLTHSLEHSLVSTDEWKQTLLIEQFHVKQFSSHGHVNQTHLSGLFSSYLIWAHTGSFRTHATTQDRTCRPILIRGGLNRFERRLVWPGDDIENSNAPGTMIYLLQSNFDQPILDVQCMT